VRTASLWAGLFGVEQTVVFGVHYEQVDGIGALVANVRPRARLRNRCGECGERRPRYDRGEGTRLWRTLDLGTTIAYLMAPAPRVRCYVHGVVVAAVPWARHNSRHTRAFEDQVAWLTTHSSKTTVAQLMRVAWRTVADIAVRVVDEARQLGDRFRGVRRIGIDEISYRKGHKYLVVVVDHDSGRLLWAGEGRDEKALTPFFEQLGKRRAARIEFVSADAASWIANAVTKHCPRAKICLDPFHVVSWATDALDVVRREVWNEARRGGDEALAKQFKAARFALWKNPENRTAKQDLRLADIAQINEPLFRAYLLKEQLREVFRLRGAAGKRLLQKWLQWARRCRIPSFVKLARTVSSRIADIEATLDYGLSNALVESTNTKIRLLHRLAFGFHSAQPLIALAMLALGGLCPSLPGRRA
jgi:transposase